MKNKLLLNAIVLILSIQPVVSQIFTDADMSWSSHGGGMYNSIDGIITTRTPRITLTNDGGFFFVVNYQNTSNQGEFYYNYSWNFFKMSEDLSYDFYGSITSGGEASDVQHTLDGGYIIVGYTSQTFWTTDIYGGKDIQIAKLDSLGNFQWQKIIGGSNDDIANSVQQTIDGGYIVAGYSSSNDFDISGNHGNNDCTIVKLNGNGNIEWQKCIGGVGNEIAYNIKETNDGGYIVVGKSNSNDGFLVNNNGGYEFLIVKLDSLGNTQWVKSIGGSNDEIAYSVQQTIDGGYIIAGQTNSEDFDIQGNHGGIDCFIVKLNENGNTEWQRCIGGTSEDVANSIQQTQDFGFIIGGYTSSNNYDISGNHGGKDFLYLKLDSNGNIIKQKCAGNIRDDMAYSVNQTVDGGVILAGDINYNFNSAGFSSYCILKYFSSLSNDNIDYLEENITISPNPASSQININFYNITDLNGGALKVINSLGQEVATAPITTSGTQSTMQFATWGGTGMYFVQIINPQGQIVDIKKIILQ